MSILFYKPPEHVLKGDGPLGECTRNSGKTRNCGKAAIPPQLSFENVICNKTQTPCSLQEFLDYLTYVTNDAENLQFYLWMVDYHKRFRRAPKAEKALSPKWRLDQSMAKKTNVEKDLSSNTATREIDLFSEDISNESTIDATQSEFTDEYTQTIDSLKFSVSPVKHVLGSNALQPPTDPQIQPFRTEINRIINHYISPGSPRQLYLSHNDRATIIRALKYTTHPTALTLVKRILDSTLRNQSHPNFIRWSICNGNRPWTWGLRIFAITNITIGFAIAIALTLSKWSRWWRIFAAIEWWFGITNIIAASQGLCVLLHRLHTRQYHEWETLNDDEEQLFKDPDQDSVQYESTKSKLPVRMEVFGPSNQFSGEPWVNSYDRKSWFRKLFEKRVGVQEEGLKAIQNRMIRQAEAWALLITIVLVVIFVAIPKGDLYP